MQLLRLLVKMLRLPAQFRLPMQWLITHTQQRCKRNPIPIPVRRHRRRLHIDRHAPAHMNLLHRQPLVKLPIPIRRRVYRPHPVRPLMPVKHLLQVVIQRIIRGDGNVQRQKTIQYAVRPHKPGRQHKISDILMIPQPAAMPHHHHRIRPQHRHMIRNRLRIRRPHANIHQRHPLVIRQHMMICRHLHRPPRFHTSRIHRMKHLHMHIIIRKQNRPLKILRIRARVMLQPVHRNIDPLRAKQKQLFLRDIPVSFVRMIEQRRIRHRPPFPRRMDRKLRSPAQKLFQFAHQKPPVRPRQRHLSRNYRIVNRPIAPDRKLGILACTVDLLHEITRIFGRFVKLLLAFNLMRLNLHVHTRPPFWEVVRHYNSLNSVPKP